MPRLSFVQRIDNAVISHSLASSILLGTSSKLLIDFIVQRSERTSQSTPPLLKPPRQSQPQQPMGEQPMIAQQLPPLEESGGQGEWEYDVRRGASFALFGLLYLGVAQQQIYGRVFPWVLSKLGVQARGSRALTQVLLDQTLVFPFVYYPMFYGIQGALNPQQLADVVSTCEGAVPKVVAGLLAGLGRWTHNMREDCAAAVVVWAPVQLANFSLVPRHWRAPFVSATGLMWTAYLSASRGATAKASTPAAAPAAEA